MKSIKKAKKEKRYEVYGVGSIGEKGQIVIPAKIRDRFDINPEDTLMFLIDNEEESIKLVKADNVDVQIKS